MFSFYNEISYIWYNVCIAGYLNMIVQFMFLFIKQVSHIFLSNEAIGSILLNICCAVVE